MNVFVVFRFVHIARVMTRVGRFDEARHHPCRIGDICAVFVVWVSRGVALRKETKSRCSLGGSGDENQVNFAKVMCVNVVIICMTGTAFLTPFCRVTSKFGELK